MSLFLSADRESLEPGISFVSAIGSALDRGDRSIEDLVSALTGAGGGGGFAAEVREFASRIGGNEALGAVLTQLAKPVSELPADGLPWSWSRSPSTTVPAGSLTIGVEFGFDFGAKLTTTQTGLQFSASGELGAAGTATLPFQYGSLTLRGGMRGRGALDYRFAHSSDPKLYEALLLDLPQVLQLAAPESLVSTPEREGRLEEATLSTLGEVRIGATLEAGRSWEWSRDIRGRQLGATLRAGGSYAIDWRHQGNYRLSVAPSNGALVIKLEDNDLTETKTALSIGAGLKIDGLDEVVNPIIEEHGDIPDQLHDLVSEFTRPTKLFRELLKKVIDEQLEDAPEKVQSLLGGLGETTSAAEAVDDLRDRLTVVADERIGNWTDLLRSRVADLAERALGQLNLGDDRETTARDQLEGLLDKGAAALRSEASSRLKSLLGDDGAVGEFLDRFASTTDTAFAELDAEAGQALAPLLDLLDRARGVKEKLLEAVEAISREELGIRFVHETQKTTTASSLLEFRLTPSGEDAQKLYRRMLVGDFHQAMEAGRDSAKPWIQLVSGLFKQAFEYRRTSGLSINLFGLRASAGTILTSDIQVECDAGEINVFDSRATLEKYRQILGERQSVKLSSSARFVEDSEALVPFSVRLNYEDDDLEKAELEEFLDSIRDAGLLDQHTVKSALAGYERLGIPDAEGDRALSIDVHYAMTMGTLDELARRDRDEVLRKAIEVQLRLQNLLMTENRRVIRKLEAEQSPAVDYVLSLVDRSELEVKRRIRRNVFNIFNRRVGGGPRVAKLSYIVNLICNNADGLHDYLQGVAELRASSPTPDRAAEIQEAHRDLMKEMRRWATVADGSGERLTGARAPVWALALLVTLKELTGESYRAVPIVRWKTKGSVERVVLS